MTRKFEHIDNKIRATVRPGEYHVWLGDNGTTVSAACMAGGTYEVRTDGADPIIAHTTEQAAFAVACELARAGDSINVPGKLINGEYNAWIVASLGAYEALIRAKRPGDGEPLTTIGGTVVVTMPSSATWRVTPAFGGGPVLARSAASAARAIMLALYRTGRLARIDP